MYKLFITIHSKNSNCIKTEYKNEILKYIFKELFPGYIL